jgi:hypothetical protein
MKWLPGRKVLISPLIVDHIHAEDGKINISLDQETIKNSPDIDTDQPVSKQNEVHLGRYYGFNPYWIGPGYWGPYYYPGELAQEHMLEEIELEKEEQNKDSHLRSVKEVTGYRIKASDGNLGHVEDFIVDEDNWVIRYMIVDTQNGGLGKRFWYLRI